MSARMKFIVPISQAFTHDISLIGNTGVQLVQLLKQDIPISEGYVLTSKAYDTLIKENHLKPVLQQVVNGITYSNADSLKKASEDIQKKILSAKIPKEITKEIFQTYKLYSVMLHNASVSLRASETCSTFLSPRNTLLENYTNISGEANIVIKIKEIWASLYSEQALLYRHQSHITNEAVSMAVCIQKTINAEKSGLLFTLDPQANNRQKIVIQAIFGTKKSFHALETGTKMTIEPDRYEVSKSDMQIKEKTVEEQRVYFLQEGNSFKMIKIAVKHIKMQKITDEQILALAALGKKIEKLYYFPQTIRWIISGKKIAIIEINSYTPLYADSAKNEKILAKGETLHGGIASGPAKMIRHNKDLQKIMSGDIAVITARDLQLMPFIKKAAAILLYKEHVDGHSIITIRRLGIPIVALDSVLVKIKAGNIITVNGMSGEIQQGGYVQSTHATSLPLNPRTKMYIDIASEDDFYSPSTEKADGAVIFSDFIIKDIGIHPKKMIRDKKGKEYVEKIVHTLEELCYSFSPRPVIYQLSSLPTNVYRGLTYGRDFESIEENPLMGYRGVIRYLHDTEVLDLELEAISILRQKKNCKNISLSVPFIRTFEELQAIKKYIVDFGLYRNENFQLWISIDVASNVWLLDKFMTTGIDGMIINAENLIMSILQLDPQNEETTKMYHIDNSLTTEILEKIISAFHTHGLPVLCTNSLASQTFMEQLISWKTTGLIIPPGTINQTRQALIEIEKTKK